MHLSYISADSVLNEILNRISGYFILLFLALFSFAFTSNAQTTWEFSGTSYAFQKAHFDSATNIARATFGIQMRTFGAPYNQIDSTFLRVMSEDTNYKVLLLGQLNPLPGTGAINLKNRVTLESATGVPNYNAFVADYQARKPVYTDYMVMQGHPYAWTTPEKLNEFTNILNYLIADSVIFNTPYGYYKYLTDTTIPRTNRVQILLKLDDLRAISYFYPSLPAYDILVSKKIKAGIGVNKLEGMTQAQKDTMLYYRSQTTLSGDTLFEIWNHGLDHSITTGSTGGNWSTPSTWPGGYVPTAVDDVIIPSGVTIKLDTLDAVCRDLTIEGVLVTSQTTPVTLTVNGDLLIEASGSFTSPSLTGATANIFHSLNVYGDFTNAGGTFDFRAGSSGTTLRGINTSFLGTESSTISVGAFTTSNNNFNGITINKTGGARVICASDVVCDAGASTGKSLLTLTSGIVETGDNTIYTLSTTSADLVTPSPTSYILGALGRGMSNSAGKANLFAVGDAYGYRPITVRSTTSGSATGHNVVVRLVHANAKKDSSSFAGGIDAVSQVRYYKISYNKGYGAGAPSMSFSQFSPSYGSDDGVQPGNTELRAAYSADERLTWNGMEQLTPHLTDLTNPPTTITPTELTTPITINSGSGYIYSALSKTTGSSNNPLPVELNSFAVTTNKNRAYLSWITGSELNSFSFIVERSEVNNEWIQAGTVKAAGTSTIIREYSFTDVQLSPGNYSYRLKIVDIDGSWKYGGIETVSIGTPLKFSVSELYPNPFSGSASVEYEIPSDSHVRITLYDPAGRVVKEIVDQNIQAGYHKSEIKTQGLSSGIYFLRVKSGVSNTTKKVLLVK